MYQPGGEAYCGPWAVRWYFHLESFVRDGESSGIGRFVGLVDGVAAVQLLGHSWGTNWGQKLLVLTKNGSDTQNVDREKTLDFQGF